MNISWTSPCVAATVGAGDPTEHDQRPQIVERQRRAMPGDQLPRRVKQRRLPRAFVPSEPDLELALAERVSPGRRPVRTVEHGVSCC